MSKKAQIEGQIRRKRTVRRYYLRAVRRAVARRAAALASGRLEAARTARRVANRNRGRARRALRDIRALRAEYHEHNALVRRLRNQRRVIGKAGLTWIDGHQVANWIAKHLLDARRAGVSFRVTSGIRTYAKALYLWNNASRLGLIRGISVARPCSSNHCGYIPPRGAVDLWPWLNFLLWLRREHRAGRRNDLQSYHDRVGGRDDVHFSRTGH